MYGNHSKPMKAMKEMVYKNWGIFCRSECKASSSGCFKSPSFQIYSQIKICEKASDVQSQLACYIKKAISDFVLIGTTTNMLSDMQNQHFISLTVHFLSGYKLHLQTLLVQLFPDVKKQMRTSQHVSPMPAMYAHKKK